MLCKEYCFYLLYGPVLFYITVTSSLIFVIFSRCRLITFICSWIFSSSLKVIEHKPYDHKADVFSFGVVVWELLTGKVNKYFFKLFQMKKMSNILHV